MVRSTDQETQRPATPPRKKQAKAKGTLARADDEVIETETMDIGEDDAAFVMGKRCATRGRIVNVSGCDVELHKEDLLLEFRGTAQQRSDAKRYAKYVMMQRAGAVTVTAEEAARECTLLQVPQEAVGLVTGKNGLFLRTIEEEHDTIMCFGDVEGVDKTDDFETLCIFGSRHARRGAQLAIMSSVESKITKYYSQKWRDSGGREVFETESDLDGDWNTITKELQESDIGLALGKAGRTRKKIDKASGCNVQLLSGIVFMSGTSRQRTLAEEYLQWIFDQPAGAPYVNTKGRDDCSVVHVPEEAVRVVTGKNREIMGSIEDQYGTLMFFIENRDESSNTEPLLILGPQRARRGADLHVMSYVERRFPGSFTQNLKLKESRARGFDTDLIETPGGDKDVSYLLGKEGATRKKLTAASNAVFNFVGNTGFISGTYEDRQRCRDYVGWILEQKDGDVNINIDGRSDVTEVEIGEGAVKLLKQDKEVFAAIREVEDETGTFIMLNRGGETLLVFGVTEGLNYGLKGRLTAARQAANVLKKGVRENEWQEEQHWQGKQAQSKDGGKQKDNRWKDSYNDQYNDRSQNHGRNNEHYNDRNANRHDNHSDQRYERHDTSKQSDRYPYEDRKPSDRYPYEERPSDRREAGGRHNDRHDDRQNDRREADARPKDRHDDRQNDRRDTGGRQNDRYEDRKSHHDNSGRHNRHDDRQNDRQWDDRANKATSTNDRNNDWGRNNGREAGRNRSRSPIQRSDRNDRHDTAGDSGNRNRERSPLARHNRSRSPIARKEDWPSNESATWSNDGGRSSRTNNRESGGHRDDDRRRGVPQPPQVPRESRDARDSGRDSRSQAQTWDYRDSASSKRDAGRDSRKQDDASQTWDYRASADTKRESRDAKDRGAKTDGGEHTWDYRESAKRDRLAASTASTPPPWRK